VEVASSARFETRARVQWECMRYEQGIASIARQRLSLPQRRESLDPWRPRSRPRLGTAVLAMSAQSAQGRGFELVAQTHYRRHGYGVCFQRAIGEPDGAFMTIRFRPAHETPAQRQH